MSSNPPNLPRMFFQRLPDEIRGSTAYRRLKAGPRGTLQAMANRGQVDDDGSIKEIRGGGWIAQAAGCCRRSIYNHLNTLIAQGLLVPLFVPNPGAMSKGRVLASLYAIPAVIGDLDHRAARRHRFTLTRRRDGTIVRTPEGQGQLFDPANRVQESCTTPVQKWHYPSAKSAHQHHGSKVFNINTMGRRRQNGISIDLSGRKIRNILPSDLNDPERLLCLIRKIIDARLEPDTEDTWQQLAALACRCTRVGGCPPAMFAALVRDRKYLFASRDDRDEGSRMLGIARFGGSEIDIPVNLPQVASKGSKDQTPKAPGKSPDEILVNACCAVGRSRTIDPYQIAKMQRPGLTQDVWAEMLRAQRESQGRDAPP